MNAPKVNELDYINFLIAAQRVFSTVEAAKTSLDEMLQPAYDAYTRLFNAPHRIARPFGLKSNQ